MVCLVSVAVVQQQVLQVVQVVGTRAVAVQVVVVRAVDIQVAAVVAVVDTQAAVAALVVALAIAVVNLLGTARQRLALGSL